MTLIEKKDLDRLVKLNRASTKDKRSALKLYRAYVSVDQAYCLNCPASVRQLFERLKNWWGKQKPNYKIIMKLKK